MRYNRPADFDCSPALHFPRQADSPGRTKLACRQALCPDFSGLQWALIQKKLKTAGSQGTLIFLYIYAYLC